MSKILMLMRHAKSSHDDPALHDIDRPLNKRGIQDSRLMGNFFKKSIGLPDLIVSSSAVRAKETTDGLIAAAEINNPYKVDNRLYATGPDTYLSVIQELPQTADKVLIVGHNPVLEETIALLCLGNPETSIVRMSTAAITCLEAEADDWRISAPGSFLLSWMMIPRLLKKMK